jgi:hypothetical protein
MGEERERSLRAPDGIRDEHLDAPAGLFHNLNALPLGILSAVMLAALLGLAGRETTLTASDGGISMTWHAPEVIRNGEVFEMRISVRSDQPIDALAVGIPAALWEDMTINTFIPAAAEEVSEDGEHRFTFGPLVPGTELLIKVDAQINPDIFGSNAGVIRVYDGDERLLELPVEIEVLP